MYLAHSPLAIRVNVILHEGALFPLIIRAMAISITVSPETAGRLRPLNVLRDLPAVADLIELCFNKTLGDDGQEYLRNMRESSGDANFLKWASRTVDSISLPLSGYVWDDGGRIVGNVSLIPFHKRGYKVYLIANVAVHPDYRRRGIARLLTDMAMQHARQKGAHSLWLQVRDDNPGAIHLYQQLGFVERMRRSEWRAKPYSPLPPPPEGYRILRRGAADWPDQAAWLAQAYPDALYWYFSPHWQSFAPGLWTSFKRALSDTSLEQWSVYQGRRLRGVISVQTGFSRVAQAWVAAPPNADNALLALLIHARQAARGFYTVAVDYPAYEHAEAFEMAGFNLLRTLVWMQAPGAQLR